MYLVILLAAGAILGGVVVVAMGRGGEMALFDRDLPVKITRLETPGEVATLQLPLGLVGYQARATGEALVAVANLLARRDAEIAALRRELWRKGGDDQAAGSDASAPGFAEHDFAAPGLTGDGFAASDPAEPDFAGPDQTDRNERVTWKDEGGREDQADRHGQAGRSDGASQADQATRP